MFLDYSEVQPIFNVVKGTNKRAKSKGKTRFSFHFRAKVPSRRSLKDSAKIRLNENKKIFFNVEWENFI